MHNFASRAASSIRRALIIAAVAASCAPAFAQAQSQAWTERPYNPAAGSRWFVESVSESDETRAGGDRRTRQIEATGELTIEEKLADGFRISYVNRDIKISGNATGTELAHTAFGAIKGIVVRARTDASGKPVTVENLAEVKSTLRAVVDRIVASMESKPKVAALMRQMLEGVLIADDKTAAAALLEDLVSLSSAQNTGLKPGMVKREADDTPSPLGGGVVKSTLTTQLTSWDDKTGTARITRKREMDKESLKAVTLDIARKLASVSDDKITPEMLDMMKQITFTIDTVTVYDINGGMTTRIEDTSATVASVAGHSFRKNEKKVVSIVPISK